MKFFRLNRFAYLIFLASVLVSCSSSNDSAPAEEPDNPVPPTISSVHVSLGVPTDADTTDDYYIIHDQYIVDYNKKLNIANWVAWELNADWYGDADRSDNFKADPLLPVDFFKVDGSSYKNSGYDRGHMVRSEERTHTDADNATTFYMTNILPQEADLNQGVWLRFEDYYKNTYIKADKELFIYAGGIFHTDNKINGKIAIPDSCFKIVVVLNRNQGLYDVTDSTLVIAVVMPNQSGVRSDSWQKYITTVDRIEESTGYDFLNSLPKRIQKIIETRTFMNYEL